MRIYKNTISQDKPNNVIANILESLENKQAYTLAEITDKVSNIYTNVDPAHIETILHRLVVEDDRITQPTPDTYMYSHKPFAQIFEESEQVLSQINDIVARQKDYIGRTILHEFSPDLIVEIKQHMECYEKILGVISER